MDLSEFKKHLIWNNRVYSPTSAPFSLRCGAETAHGSNSANISIKTLIGVGECQEFHNPRKREIKLTQLGSIHPAQKTVK